MEVIVNTVVEVNTKFTDEKKATWNSSIKNTKNKLVYTKYLDLLGEEDDLII